MLEKDQLGGGKVRVTFLMPALEGVGTLSVCGEFNDWSPAAAPMTRAADGTWSAALTLEAGRSYQFRYRDDRGGWHNDPAADTYVPNDFGSENSVVDLRDKPSGAGAGTAPRKTAPSKVAPAKPAPSKAALQKPAPKKNSRKKPRGKGQ